jgi:hypothetical protein
MQSLQSLQRTTSRFTFARVRCGGGQARNRRPHPATASFRLVNFLTGFRSSKGAIVPGSVGHSFGKNAVDHAQQVGQPIAPSLSP